MRQTQHARVFRLVGAAGEFAWCVALGWEDDGCRRLDPSSSEELPAAVRLLSFREDSGTTAPTRH